MVGIDLVGERMDHLRWKMDKGQHILMKRKKKGQEPDLEGVCVCVRVL